MILELPLFLCIQNILRKNTTYSAKASEISLKKEAVPHIRDGKKLVIDREIFKKMEIRVTLDCIIQVYGGMDLDFS
jgi:hypothetical protein